MSEFINFTLNKVVPSFYCCLTLPDVYKPGPEYINITKLFTHQSWSINYTALLLQIIEHKVSQKQKSQREKERKTEIGNNNGQLRIANGTSGGAGKAACLQCANKCF